MVELKEILAEEQYKEFINLCIARAQKFNNESDWKTRDIRADAQNFFRENQDMYQNVLKCALIELDEAELKSAEDGICQCVSMILFSKYYSIKECLDTSGTYIEPHGLSAYIVSVMLTQINTLVYKWSAYSGNNLFPVPLYLHDPMEAYEKAKKLGTMWVGEYGDNRKALLKFLIAQLN